MKPFCQTCGGTGLAEMKVGYMRVTMTCPEISNDNTYHGAES